MKHWFFTKGQADPSRVCKDLPLSLQGHGSHSHLNSNRPPDGSACSSLQSPLFPLSTINLQRLEPKTFAKAGSQPVSEVRNPACNSPISKRHWDNSSEKSLPPALGTRMFQELLLCCQPQAKVTLPLLFWGYGILWSGAHLLLSTLTTSMDKQHKHFYFSLPIFLFANHSYHLVLSTNDQELSR